MNIFVDVLPVNQGWRYVSVLVVLKEEQDFLEDLLIIMIIVNIHHYNN